jgi:hypothetical protein
LGLVLWLIFMLIYSPIIGWGFFGAGGSGHQLPPDNPLYIGSAGKFVILTLLLHAVYGIIVGWLDRVWIDWSEEERQVME